MKTLKGTCKHCGHIQEETTKHDNVSCSTGYCDKCGKVGMNMYEEMKNKDWEKEIQSYLVGLLDGTLAEREFTANLIMKMIEEQRKQAKIEAVREFARWLDKEYSSVGIFNPKEGAEQYIKNLEGEK